MEQDQTGQDQYFSLSGLSKCFWPIVMIQSFWADLRLNIGSEDGQVWADNVDPDHTSPEGAV